MIWGSTVGVGATGARPEGVGRELTCEIALEGAGVIFGESSAFQLRGQSLNRCPTL